MRSALRPLMAVAVLAIAGCAGAPTGPDTGAETTVTTDGPADTTAATTASPDWKTVDYDSDGPPPEPPATLSAERVRNVAAQAEAAHLRAVLSNASELRDYGIAGYTVDPGAYVLDSNGSVALVRVRLGYSFKCGASIVDGVSRATYRVSTESVARVAGTTIEPSC